MNWIDIFCMAAVRNGSGRAIGGMAKYLTPNTPENPFLSDRIDRAITKRSRVHNSNRGV